ncbi:VOC family protein [Shewanella donghaensis]|uniref:VOC family protein n=1 Tax=Shewanella donghaensis TaxID=238836 RepID=UPI001181FC5C|nr:VOC family protein [Shewanella donghaensis]
MSSMKQSTATNPHLVNSLSANKPTLNRIDHIHIYVRDRAKALIWYQQVLGFEVIEELAFWSKDGGPLTIKLGDIHLALFESINPKYTTVAFGVDAENYVLWQQHLASFQINYTESDHDITWSIYFADPDGNPFEITSFEYQEIANAKVR